MFEKFLHADSGDFRQRYEGTYGFFSDHKTGKRLLVHLERVDLEDSPRKVVFRDRRGVDFSIKADVQDEIGFEFLPPKSAFYNTMNGVYYVERVAARQFRRGICDNNCNVYILNERGFRRSGVNFDTLSAIFERPIEIQAAIERFKTGALPALALSPFMAILDGTLYMYKEPIGTLQENTITLKEGGMLFITELQDALKTLQLNYQVATPKEK